MKIALVLLLLATPLAAQIPETITLEPATVNVQVEPTPFVNEITIMSDSVRLDRIAVALENLATIVENQECNTCGGASTTTKLGLGVMVPLLTWIAISLSKSANKDDNHTINTEVNVPPREPRKPKHGGES